MSFPTDPPPAFLNCRVEIIEGRSPDLPGAVVVWGRCLQALANVRRVREAFDAEMNVIAGCSVLDTYTGDQLTVDVPFETAAALVERFDQHVRQITRLTN